MLFMSSPADRPDWSYALLIMGERDLFDEDDGAGPASCSAKLLPVKEASHLMVVQTDYYVRRRGSPRYIDSPEFCSLTFWKQSAIPRC